MTKLLEKIVDDLKKKGITKNSFCHEHIETKHPEFSSMTREEIEKNANTWALESTCIGLALKHLGYITDKRILEYLNERGGVYLLDEDCPLNEVPEIVTFRDVLKNLSD